MKQLFITALTAIAVTTSAAQAQETVKTFPIGNAKVSVLSDGNNDSGADGLIGATPEILKAALPNGGTYKRGMHAFLMQTPEHTILIDAGIGRNMQSNLNALGVKPADVDIILLTHAHGDHIGGLVADDKVVFPNATLYVAENEYNAWAGNERGASAMRVFNLYANKLKKFTPAVLGTNTSDLVPGIKAYAAYGHTPGHTVFLAESGNGKVLFWGDITHAMAIQMKFPQVALSFDTDVEKAISARRAVFDYAAKEKVPVCGAHIPFPGIGVVARSGNAYSYDSM
jgi:glyoxylase-like metal-dependent hydrolase (beta-lactamase superfamily II)